MSDQKLYTAGITGVGMDFPERRLTNADLEKMVETNEQWILERTGISERRLVEPGTPASHHGAGAARMALEHAGLTPDDVDLILVPTVTPDMFFPATACVIQDLIGAGNAWGYDISAACSGFVFAVQAARAQVQTGACRRVLVVGTEIMSSIVDYDDRNTCVLFGDGAGAVLIERVDPELEGIIDFVHHVDGKGGKHLNMPGGGSLNPPSEETVRKKMHYIYQEGREVFKFAVRGMVEVAQDVLARNNHEAAELKVLIPHQANIRIIDGAQKRLGLTDEQMVVTIDRFGNTTSASIPSAMRVAYDEGRLQKGDLVCLASFGAGFTWGATLLRWAID